MGEYSDAEVAAWRTIKGDEKIPGSAYPLEGKCGAHLRNKAIRDMEAFLEVERGSSTKRFCAWYAGAGTNHEGFGPCKLHLGNMANLEKRYLPEAINRDIHTLAELWDMPVGIDPAPVEANRLFVKVKKTMLVLEQMVLEAGEMEAEDLHGRKQLRPLLEMWERSQDRFLDFVKFSLKYDLSARRLELVETQAREIASAVLSVVMDPTLQLEDWQLDRIRENLARVMMEMAPALAPEWMNEFQEEDE